MIKLTYTPEVWDTPLGSLSDPSPMQEMTMTLTTDGMTWDEATREFHNFLRAAGFVIPYDIEWYEDGKDVHDDDADPLQKLTDWEEKYRSEECEVVKTFDQSECVGIMCEWGRIEWQQDATPHVGSKLYTAPPKREWVGLEGAWGVGNFYPPEFVAGAEWAEAKLKEKNT